MSTPERIRPGVILGKPTPEGVRYANSVIGETLDAEMIRTANIPPAVTEPDDVRPDHIV